MNALVAGSALDLLLGDPHWLPHPVRGFGWIATRLEGLCRRECIPLRLAGIAFWAVSVGTGVTIVRATLPRASAYWVWTLLAARDLDLQARAVAHALERGDIEAARRKLSMIVGRDTATLDRPDILRAVVETVAENLNDGVIAPLFYYAVAGVPGMAAYKCINTLDSMVGYKDERYRQFGWFSARMDDLANLIPARLTAVLTWVAASILRLQVRRSVWITMRDAGTQPSPNSGYPEAAFAGALGVRLGGLNHYNGKASVKAYLGDPVNPLDATAFRHSRRLLYTCAALMLGAVLVIRREY